MAEHLGDTGVVNQTAAALSTADAALSREFWNSTGGFFRAHN